MAIGKLKDGRTHMAYKPEHVVHPADQGDRKTMAATLDDAQARLGAVKAAIGIDEPFDLVADKGYHSREVLKGLPDACCSRISEPKHRGQLRWHGDITAREAVYGNRARLRSCKGKALLRARAEKVERSFAHCLDRGGMRRVLLLETHTKLNISIARHGDA